MIYLDGAATSKLLPCAKNAIISTLEEDFGNASALHTPGHLAKNLIESARKNIANLIGANPEEIIFTSGGSESNNTIINTFKNKTIVVSAIEHPSVLEPAKKYAKTLKILPVNEQGIIDLNHLKPADLYSVMLANNELGTLEPIKELRKKLPKSTFLHSDLTQAIGKIKINIKDLDLDYATISAHKFGGPIGIGAIYVKHGKPLKPLILGGHQEYGLRAGTYQTANIAGFGAAAEFALKNQTWKTYTERVAKLRNSLTKRILEEIPFSSLNTPLENSLPNILNVSFEAAEGESIQLYLDAAGIAVSTGSACASGDGKPSHVLMATKNDAEIAHSSIRFSFSLDSTKKDVDSVMKVLPKIIQTLQQISTITPKGEK